MRALTSLLAAAAALTLVVSGCLSTTGLSDGAGGFGDEADAGRRDSAAEPSGDDDESNTPESDDSALQDGDTVRVEIADDPPPPEMDSTPAAATTTDGGAAQPTDAGTTMTPAPTADAAPVNVCAGKPNGFAYRAGTNGRCCSQKAVSINGVSNCGGCGIQCPSGFTCGQVKAGEWGCHCATNAQCAGAGYGAGATCYTDSTGSWCNCQCPGGAASCTGQCRGGAACSDTPGQNYCHY